MYYGRILLKDLSRGAVVVAPLAEWSLPTPEVRGSLDSAMPHVYYFESTFN